MTHGATVWQRLRTVVARGRFGPFALVGLVSTMTTIGLTSMLSSLVHIELRFAAFIGYVAGMTCGYLLNRFYVFQHSRQRQSVFQVMLFLSVNAASATAYAYTSQWLDAELPRLVALCLAVAFSTIINYIGYRYLVFTR
jgi:putative flippase GtrA